MSLSFRQFVLSNPGKLFEVDTPPGGEQTPAQAYAAMRAGVQGLGATPNAAQPAYGLPAPIVDQLKAAFTTGQAVTGATPLGKALMALASKPGMVPNSTMTSMGAGGRSAYPFLPVRQAGFTKQGQYTLNPAYDFQSFLRQFGADLQQALQQQTNARPI